MKCKITAIAFAIAILYFATVAVAQPQFPRIAPGAASGVLNLGVLNLQGSDGKSAKEGLSERELLCKDLVAFAFPESQSQDPLARSGDTSDIFVRTFYPEEGLPYLRTRGRSRWGLSDHVSPGNQSRGVARLDRVERNQTVQEQSRVLYNLCKTPLIPSK